MPSTTSLSAHRVGAVLIGVFLLGAGGGCGRKLPPIQPGVFPPPTVADLAQEVQGNEIVLSWTIPAFTPDKESAATGFKILRARQTAAEAECQECPAPFEAIGDVWASGKKPGSRLKFRDALEPGFKYSYKLRAYTADEVVGRNSNVVAVVY